MSPVHKRFYGVWAFSDRPGRPDDWIRDADSDAILAFESKRKACAYATNNWGFASYTETKRAGWCEVKPL